MTFINHAPAPGLSLSPHSPCPTPAPLRPRQFQHGEDSPHGRSSCLRPERASSVSPWRTRALGEGARGGLFTATWLLTHDSTREKCRSLTHLLWRVLQTTRKAITLQVIRSTSAYDSALIPLLKSQLGGGGEWRVAGQGAVVGNVRSGKGGEKKSTKRDICP